MRTALMMLLAIGAADTFAGQVKEADRQNIVGGTYSSICLHRDTDDLIGLEISLIPSASGTSVLYQRAEGELRQPELFFSTSKSGRISLKGDGKVFRIEQGSPSSIVVTLLDGSVFENGQKKAELARRSAIWSNRSEIRTCSPRGKAD